MKCHRCGWGWGETVALCGGVYHSKLCVACRQDLDVLVVTDAQLIDLMERLHAITTAHRIAIDEKDKAHAARLVSESRPLELEVMKALEAWIAKGVERKPGKDDLFKDRAEVQLEEKRFKSSEKPAQETR